MAIQLIVGLGNPGPEYAETRHNVGAWFVQALAERESTSLKTESKFFGLAAKVNSFSKPFWLLTPTTYMNESGRAVAAIARFYKIPAQNILVAHDELDFSPGTIRIKENGGHGGHNGLRDIIKALGSDDFLRLRIGIGHPGHKDKVTPYVLHTPNRTDRSKIMQSLDEGMAVLPDLVSGDMQQAFRYLHSD